jgi:hypothetical protein
MKELWSLVAEVLELFCSVALSRNICTNWKVMVALKNKDCSWSLMLEVEQFENSRIQTAAFESSIMRLSHTSIFGIVLPICATICSATTVSLQSSDVSVGQFTKRQSQTLKAVTLRSNLRKREEAFIPEHALEHHYVDRMFKLLPKEDFADQG